MRANLTDAQWQEMVMDSILQVGETVKGDTLRASAVFDECPISEPKAFNQVLIQLKRAGRICGKVVKNDDGNVIDILITVIDADQLKEN